MLWVYYNNGDFGGIAAERNGIFREIIRETLPIATTPDLDALYYCKDNFLHPDPLWSKISKSLFSIL